MIDKNGKVMKMTPTKRKEFLASQLDLPRTTRGLGKDVKTKDIFTYLFKKEYKGIVETLDIIRDIDPRTYLKVMIEMGKLSMAADKDLDNKSIASELNELIALRDKKVSKEPDVVTGTYTEFTEVKDEKPDKEEIPPVEKIPEPEPIMEHIPKPKEFHYDKTSHPAIKEDLRSLGLPSIPKK